MSHPRIPRRKGEAFRTAFDGPVTDFGSLFRHAAAEALDILSRASSTLAQRRYAEAHLRQYHELLAGLKDESAAWISANLPASCQAGISFADDQMVVIRKSAKEAGINLGVPESAVFAGVHREAAEVAIQALQRTIDHALAQVGRRADDLFRRVTIEEVAQGIAEGKARRAVSQAIKERLEGAKLQFIDKGGRKWDLDQYAEMAARTTTREAMTQGTLNRLREHGIQLAQVSAHNASDFCLYYENMVVCIGPEPHPIYPSIDAIGGGPPFHPNCAHTMHPFVEVLATPEERKAGEPPPGVLYKTPAQLQRRFRKDYPERAAAEGKRIRQQAAINRRRAAKRARRKERIAAGEITPKTRVTYPTKRDRFIRDIVDEGRKMTPAEAGRVLRHIEQARFSERPVDVEKDIRGKPFRDVKLKARMPSDIAHLAKRVLHEQQWPANTTMKSYLRDLRRSVRHPEAQVYTYVWGKGGNAPRCVGVVAPNHVKGPKSQPLLFVAYSAKDGRILTGYQVGSPEDVGGIKAADWAEARTVKH